MRRQRQRAGDLARGCRHRGGGGAGAIDPQDVDAAGHVKAVDDLVAGVTGREVRRPELALVDVVADLLDRRRVRDVEEAHALVAVRAPSAVHQLVELGRPRVEQLELDRAAGVPLVGDAPGLLQQPWQSQLARK
jgi:hypothetical protein